MHITENFVSFKKYPYHNITIDSLNPYKVSISSKKREESLQYESLLPANAKDLTFFVLRSGYEPEFFFFFLVIICY